MPDAQSSDVQRPPTPEKRSHRVGSANPTDAGNEVWFRPPGGKEYAAFKIASVKKEEDGTFAYQIKGIHDKVSYSNGMWIPQKKVKKSV
ncbi:hypothetical protein PG993_012882 [Apiospora rasikravindrae]|uniref:Uncharacterized protein n=1 Tax=Apiospora rasikravindrae TaxID=990691 RepID=A0ABR1RXC0_9PEZI